MGSISELEHDSNRRNTKPPGIRFLEFTNKSNLSFKTHQAIVLIVTFLAYTTYHASRKTTSIIKTALHPQTPDHTLQPDSLSRVLRSGWAPFDGANGTGLLGDLDFAFLFVYAVGIFFSGHIGDRMNIRIFLTIGMMGTGLFTLLFGVGYWANIHAFYYYLIVQMIAGLFQSTGWPSVVAVVGNWFGKSRRGLIMGVWNANTSVGNISGSLIASYFLKYGWGWSIVVPSLIIAFLGVVVYLFLPVDPESVGVRRDEDESGSLKTEITEHLLSSKMDDEKGSSIGFLEAWKIPGVVPFAFCLFFVKFVSYTFTYWLPFYISQTAINGEYLSNEAAGNLSTLFDVGGLVGGILIGHISDKVNARAITAATFIYCAIPTMHLYRSYGHVSMPINIILMLITGMFVIGASAFISAPVAVDLGTHRSLRGNSKALATVTGIIDGTGSIGSAIGPVLTGYISSYSWNAVFVMLMVAGLAAGLFLTNVMVAEVRAKCEKSQSRQRGDMRFEDS